jgi:hypothetical protein
VEAALEIIDLCRLLRDETGLARASFTEFSSCRAALLVILAQGLTKRTERLGAALEQGISLIKIMSMGVGSARSAVSVIEALERAIRRLEAWSETQPEIPNGGTVESAYDRFKNWEMLWKAGPISPSTLAWQQQETFSPSEPKLAHSLPAHASAVPGPATMMPGAPMTPPSAAMLGPSGPIPTPGGPDQELAEGDVPGSALSDTFSISQQSLSHMPHFGFDHFVSNFPQELGEFTAIPCFEPDAQGQSNGMGGPEMRTPGSASDPHWLQFMRE